MHAIPLDDYFAQAGLGLRHPHLPAILNQTVEIPWFELLADNWLAKGGLTRYHLDAIVERYPVSLHGVGLSLGGMDALDFSYLSSIKDLIKHTQALAYSEHLCFSQLQSHYSHDLLPLVYTDESIKHVVKRIIQVQDFLGCPVLIENVSSYLQYQESELSEGQFIAAIAEEADCALLLDINNFYVNQVNHGDDALSAIHCLPVERIKEIHLAGFSDHGRYLIDAHNHPVSAAVWDLYQKALGFLGGIPTLIEWDKDLPSFARLQQEQQTAQGYLTQHQSLTI